MERIAGYLILALVVVLSAFRFLKRPDTRLSLETRRRALMTNASAAIAVLALWFAFVLFVESFMLHDHTKTPWGIAAVGIFAVSTVISVRSFRRL